MLSDALEWCGLLVDYCDVFIRCLDPLASLVERPPPAPASRVRDPLGELVRTRVGGVTLVP